MGTENRCDCIWLLTFFRCIGRLGVYICASCSATCNWKRSWHV